MQTLLDWWRLSGQGVTLMLACVLLAVAVCLPFLVRQHPDKPRNR